MSLSVFPSASRVAAGTPAARDRAVDVARIVSLLVVMFGHCTFVLATVNSDGVKTGNLLAQVPHLQPLTWILQIMPLFFLAGAASAAYGLDSRSVGDRQPWGVWLLRRTQRLARPVFWYLAAWSLALAATRFFAGPTVAARMGEQCVALLWFIGVYIVILAFVPVLAHLRTRRGFALVVVGLLVAAALCDAARIHFDSMAWGMPNFVFVWLIPAAIGVAYARRRITPTAALAIAVGALALNVVVDAVGPYEVSLVVTGNEKLSNVTPPTVVLGLHCVWMSLAFVAAARQIGRWARRPRVWRWVAIGNGGAMTLYLWHIPAIVATIALLHVAGLDAYDPAQPYFWPLLALRAAAFAVVMTAMFVALLPAEHRRLPWWDDDVTATGVRAAAMGALLCAGGVAILVMAKMSLGAPLGWAGLVGFFAALAAARALGSAPADESDRMDALPVSGGYEEPLAHAASAES
ncbi:MAG: acyltransferase [Gordonia sp. (in: high G+C Gram-positive bacteria)]|uniref:acyltransferase family protein n=1 Tax=Gordonia sp. (in: high G+C Gram-positive bacteria) TaxID=84139 RepID=UPI0039E2270D